jgi:hypothetical protein
MTRDLAGSIVVSDAPEFDARWLARLATACGQAPPFPIYSINHAIPLLAEEAGIGVAMAIRRYIKSKPAGASPHRAGPDAERLMNQLLSIRGKKSRRRTI